MGAVTRPNGCRPVTYAADADRNSGKVYARLSEATCRAG